MFRKVRRYLKDPYFALGDDLIQKHPEWMSDKFYLSVLWHHVMGYKLDWKNPKTFNEKLQWLKLNDRNPLYTTLVDKYAVKQWVADKIGDQYIIPTLKVYDSVDEINLDELPDRFVLKCTHDSGSIAICSDKSSFDFEKAKLKLQQGLETNFYLIAREWPYKNVPPRIIAEEFIESDTDDLYDYKFYCFNGIVRFFKVDYDRQANHKALYYDRDGNLLPFGEVKFLADKPKDLVLPKELPQMIEQAEKLSQGIPFVRMDFYCNNGDVRFGESTFFQDGGFGKLSDMEWEQKLGEYINTIAKVSVRGGGVKDYKFFCFNGEPRFMYISCDKAEHPTTDFFDMDFNLLPIKLRDENSLIPPGRPKQFEEMKKLAAILSKGIPEVRVDFYIVKGKVKFGEMTFYHNGGFTPIQPKDWNEKIGSWIHLK